MKQLSGNKSVQWKLVFAYPKIEIEINFHHVNGYTGNKMIDKSISTTCYTSSEMLNIEELSFFKWHLKLKKGSIMRDNRVDKNVIISNVFFCL